MSALFELVPSLWRPHLAQFETKINEIGSELRNRADAGERILPDRARVFRALEISPDEVRVLLVGQDPYPNPQDACGLAFSVSPRNSGLPGSLLNIQKEILTDIGATTTSDGDLSRWSMQGVMLLNRTLTVSAGDSASHAALGWEEITLEIARVCAANGAVALLWGNYARQLEPLFESSNCVTGVHPSPLSAHRGFLGSKPFSKVNAALSARGFAPIVW